MRLEGNLARKVSLGMHVYCLAYAGVWIGGLRMTPFSAWGGLEQEHRLLDQLLPKQCGQLRSDAFDGMRVGCLVLVPAREILCAGGSA